MLEFLRHWGVWTAAAGLFLALLLLLAVSEIECRSMLRRRGENDHVALRIRALYGAVKVHREIPIVRLDGANIAYKSEQSSNLPLGSAPPTEEGRVGPEKVMSKLEQARLLMRHTDRFTVWLLRTLRYIRITEWRWISAVGAGDAAWTAVATGMASAAQGALLGLLSHVMRLTGQPQMQVRPVFNDTIFSTEWHCTVKVRLGHVLLAGLRLLLRIRRVKGGIQTWRSLLFKA
ncbi:DUF2953 domain-containing protein [Paenibacillus sp. IB182496]|uniref:DUF2953 domain-containing protein n=1 Tax=Paenibacillus sabuli TaxID=2772509 RepID=A0A927GSJ4_9BACL|nr:DUF2953 domain-containing protein [Paenibacillus sabuli]MBD2846809.1 DUF2953 domain-containing protein [Paenibacillus sabuli]